MLHVGLSLVVCVMEQAAFVWKPIGGINTMTIVTLAALLVTSSTLSCGRAFRVGKEMNLIVNISRPKLHF